MSSPMTCTCASAPALVLACSGAADVGEITDQAARLIARSGQGRMFCLPGVGGRISGIVESSKASAKVLVLDGCSNSCARRCLEQAGISGFQHIQLADLGMEKGKSPSTQDRIAKAADAAARLIR